MNLNQEEINKGAEEFNNKYTKLVEKTGYFFRPAVTSDEEGNLKLILQIYKKNETKDESL